MDCLNIWDRDIQEITEKGIRYTGGFIDFEQCAARYQQERGGSGRCVGERGSMGKQPCLCFYTPGLSTRVAFASEGRIKELLHKKTPAKRRAEDIGEKLSAFGYTLADAE